MRGRLAITRNFWNGSLALKVSVPHPIYLAGFGCRSVAIVPAGA